MLSRKDDCDKSKYFFKNIKLVYTHNIKNV